MQNAHTFFELYTFLEKSFLCHDIADMKVYHFNVIKTRSCLLQLKGYNKNQN